MFNFRFGFGRYYYFIQYGYMSYPLRHMSQTASVFMTVAITFERYCAVHYPINYREVKIKFIRYSLHILEKYKLKENVNIELFMLYYSQ